MEFFLDPKNDSIWSEVQSLAQKNDKATLQKYVAEAQRLTSPFRIVRYPSHHTKVEGKSVGPDNVVIVNIVSSPKVGVRISANGAQAEAARNKDKVPNAVKFDPDRQQPEITSYSYGPHECFGRHLAVVFVTGLVKLCAGLKNLRPAPGPMGQVKKIQVGSERIFLNDSWSYFAFNVSSKYNHPPLFSLFLCDEPG